MMTDFTNDNRVIMLKKFINNVAIKRLINEHKELKELSSSLSISFNEEFDKLSIFIYDKEEFKKENVIEIVINENYPFRQPNIIINSQPYERFLLFNDDCISLQILQKKYGIKCLYDKSYINTDNWSPAITLTNIIIEIRENIEIIEKIRLLR
jgi:ubiquitin-protein ligase